MIPWKVQDVHCNSVSDNVCNVTCISKRTVSNSALFECGSMLTDTSCYPYILYTYRWIGDIFVKISLLLLIAIKKNLLWDWSESLCIFGWISELQSWFSTPKLLIIVGVPRFSIMFMSFWKYKQLRKEIV